MKRSVFPSLRVFAVILLLLTCLTGCSGLPFFDRSYRYVQPTVAVFKFDNKAPFPLKWDLGEGMADQMVSGLMATKRFTVLERQDIGAVLEELQFQSGGVTRKEGKVPPQRVKNAQYLLKGRITDFTHVARGGIGIGYHWFRIGGGGTLAIVSMVIQVIDVESGQVLLAKTVSANAWAAELDLAATYQGVSFGGTAFYRTPLGKATQSAIDDAIGSIVKVIGRIPWRPVINSINKEWAVLNGGEDRRVKEGTLYHVIQPGQRIFDRETGDLLGSTPGARIGVLQVVQVFDRFSYARLLKGSCGEVGYNLEPLTSDEIDELGRLNP
jgi:curli biogenesis system outer membrane secretion channel CsgG